jgi:hypothetical protein
VGIAVARIRASRRYGILLLATGALGSLYYVTDGSDGLIWIRLSHVAFGVLFSLSWAVLGYTLWSNKSTNAQDRVVRRKC